MNINRIISDAIRDMITESDIKEAVYAILSEEVDFEDVLKESDTLKDRVYNCMEEAIENLFEER